MGSLFTTLIIFVVVSSIMSALGGGSKKRNDRRWPGPVAGPGMPDFPRPMRPTPPAPPPRPAQPRLSPMTPSPTGNGRPTQPWTGAGGEGVSTEGVGTEGPKEGEDVYTELSRFQRELEQDINVDRDVPVDRDLKQDIRQLETSRMSLTTTLQQTADPSQPVPMPDDAATVGLDELLANRGNLAQAVVLAEVLGKPKALRRSGHLHK